MNLFFALKKALSLYENISHDLGKGVIVIHDSNQFLVYILLMCSIFTAVIILVPTRELALQTSQVCKELGKHLKIQVMVTTGGTSLKDDIMRLYQPVHLLVGTPGRILDLSKKGICVLNECAMLVMDEVS